MDIFCKKLYIIYNSDETKKDHICQDIESVQYI